MHAPQLVQCLLIQLRAMQRKLFVPPLYTCFLCVLVCVCVCLSDRAVLQRVQMPQPCPGTSVGWFLHKWNAAVD